MADAVIDKVNEADLGTGRGGGGGRGGFCAPSLARPRRRRAAPARGTRGKKPAREWAGSSRGRVLREARGTPRRCGRGHTTREGEAGPAGGSAGGPGGGRGESGAWAWRRGPPATA